MRRLIPLLFAATALLSFLACSGGSEPVGELEISPKVIPLGYPDSVAVELLWTPTAALETPDLHPTVFVHILAEPGEVLRTFDHFLPEDWQPGQPIRYEFPMWQSALGPALPAGRYPVSIGIYDSTGQRWPLVVDGEEVDSQEYVVAEVEIPNPRLDAPRVTFGGNWLALEPGSDGQSLASRWVETDGSIEFQGAKEPLTVNLQLRLPDMNTTEHRLILEEGASQPQIVVRSGCSEDQDVLTGFGSYFLTVKIEPDAEGQCAISIDTNYLFLEAATLTRRSALLENLMWSETSR